MTERYYGVICGIIMLMKGTTLEFKQKAITGVDEFNNPTGEIVGISISDCLIAPITEPQSVREQQAMHQARDQVRIHLPKTCTADLSNSYIAWGGKIFQIDSDSVVFMDENTPTRWNRYMRAESVGQYDQENPTDIWLRFFITEDSNYVLAQESS